MDMQSLIGTLMSSESLDGISQVTHTTSDDTRSVLSAALPLLLSGAQAQSQNANTAASFGNALFNHGQQNTSNVSSFLQGVDLLDGGKIIGHLLGLNNNSAMNMISQQTGVSNQNTTNILSAAAPLLMSLLGQQLGSNSANASPSLLTTNATNTMQGMNMTSLLGSLLGAQQPVQQQKPSLLGSLLGGLFGR
jgi:hypothetical protein